MEVKTGQSLLESILHAEVFNPPSPLRFADHVSLNASRLSVFAADSRGWREKDSSTGPGWRTVARLAVSS